MLDEDKKCTLTLTRAQPLKMAGRKWSRKRERYKTALTDSWTVSLNVRDPWESIARQINPGSLPNASVTTPHARPVAYWSWIGWRETILSTRTFGLGLFYEEKVLGGKVSYIYIWYAFDVFACVLWAIYFLGFYMFKIHVFPKLFFTEVFKWSDAIFPSRWHDGQEKYQSSSRSMM